MFWFERRKFRKIFLRVCRDGLDANRVELSLEDASLLQMCVAVVLGGVFQN
jgi:hypothetical protein